MKEDHVTRFIDDAGCICKGNWRNIVNNISHLISSRYRQTDGTEYVLFGVVDGGDDYYYGLSSNGGMDCKLLPCSLSIEEYGYTRILDGFMYHTERIAVYNKELVEARNGKFWKEVLPITNQMQYHLREIDNYARKMIPSVSY